MVLPECHHAAQQIRAAQERAVLRDAGSDDDMIPAAGARVPPVQHELLGAEPRLASEFVKLGCVLDEFFPRRRWLYVDFDHTRIRRYLENRDAWIVWRGIAPNHDGDSQVSRGFLDRRAPVEVV